MARLRISLSSNPMVGQAVVLMFNMRTVTHIGHLSTTSDAQHRALQAFYEGIVGLADRFAEAAISIYGPISDWPSGDALTDGLVLDMQPAEYMAKSLEVFKTRVLPSVSGQPDLENIVSEIIELCNSTKYKLENLS